MAKKVSLSAILASYYPKDYKSFTHWLLALGRIIGDPAMFIGSIGLPIFLMDRVWTTDRATQPELLALKVLIALIAGSAGAGTYIGNNTIRAEGNILSAGGILKFTQLIANTLWPRLGPATLLSTTDSLQTSKPSLAIMDSDSHSSGSSSPPTSDVAMANAGGETLDPFSRSGRARGDSLGSHSVELSESGSRRGSNSSSAIGLPWGGLQTVTTTVELDVLSA